MEKSIIVRYGEIFLKGKNKSYFERTLIHNIKNALASFEFNIYKISGRFIVNKYDDQNERAIIDKLTKVFGIHSVSPSVSFATSLDAITNYIGQIKLSVDTFKVDVNRADKLFELNSTELARILGAEVLKTNPNLKVNLKNPQATIFVDIRESKQTFVFYDIYKGAGGMPVSTSGKGLLLLSGGIDSPVAGYLMAKRGLTLNAIHFHSFPYTSEQAKQKVITLARILTEYTGDIKLHIVPFTKIQEEIHKNCSSEYMITLMRRFMMRIAETVAQKEDIKTIITGESLAQVASQTVESITATNSVIKTLPVFRPLIGNDKEDIVAIAKNINTFETSILPYEDCCTVFLPESPIIKPKLYKVEQEESKLNVADLINEAVQNIEVMVVTNK